MFQPRLKTVSLAAFILLFSSTLFAREKKDTIYYDEDFSICEQPVAEYYRVCVLNRVGNIFYKGKVEDYFINGKLKMTAIIQKLVLKMASLFFIMQMDRQLKKEITQMMR